MGLFQFLFMVSFTFLVTLIVADSGNNRICRVTPDGYVETIAGSFKGFKDGVGIDAKFDNPFNLRIDKNDNVYIVDVGNIAFFKNMPTNSNSF